MYATQLLWYLPRILDSSQAFSSGADDKLLERYKFFVLCRILRFYPTLTLQMATTFSISVVSDTVCPWCYIGKRRLESGIAAFLKKHPEQSNATFKISWHPFYLNPNAPKDSIQKEEMYAAKFGPQRANMIFDRLRGAGDEAGIEFKFGGKTGNTRDSHRLLAFAAEKEGDAQDKVVNNLFRAYFEEEKDITDHTVLLDAAKEAGLPEDEVKKLLQSDQEGPTVDNEVMSAQKMGVTGVPNFTIQDMFVVEGAQEPNAFVQLFERVLKLDKSMA